ncbi:hypothetical protein DFR30_1365 [Thiogranum longum]|uniref:Uncharacterized protein n=1 Tax=Thiogranum longum TaxID=1537524 RepID=A0A4V2PGT8_9GAMM|nr:hypothetical protein [Thiogranum longum]TCK18106.1 hypothetical protein DFR30_1365 [Thiogranum longum]
MGEIIEITGIPGVGKTTLVNELSGLCGENCCIYNDAMILPWSDSLYSSELLTRFVCDALLVFYGFRSGWMGLALMKYTGRVLFNRKMSIWFKLRVFGNIVRKLGRIQYCKENLGNLRVFIDEGLGHVPFNLQDYHENADITCISEYYKYAKKFTADSRLIVLDDEGVDVFERLLDRGHARTYNRSVEWAKKFNLINKEVITAIKREAICAFKDVRVIKINDNTASYIAQEAVG